MSSFLAIFAPAVALGSAGFSVLLALGSIMSRRKRYRKIVVARRQLKGDLATLQQKLEAGRPERIDSHDIRIALPTLLGMASELESGGNLLGALEKYEEMLERSQDRPDDPVATESASLAAAKIEKLSAGLDRPGAERVLLRAATTLSRIRIVDQ